MKAIPSRWWLWLALASTGLAAALLITDALPLLRGPAPWPPEWRWLYEPLGARHLARQAVGWALLGGYLAAALWALRGRSLAWVLALAVGFLLLWQLALTWMREQSVLDTLIARIYSPVSNGYLLAPAQVDDLGWALHHYVDALPTFFSTKPRTHPPGLFLLYAAVNGLFERWDAFSAWLAPIARTWALPHRDWPLLPDHLIASAFATGWLQVGLTALTPLGMFGFVRELGRGRARDGALWSAMAVPLIPALGLFLSQWDAVYPLLGLLAWALALRAGRRAGEGRRAWGWWLLAGLVLGFMSWLSYGLLVMAGIVGLHALLRAWWPPARPSFLPWGARPATLLGLVVMVTVLVLPWLAGWLVWGMRFDELFRASMAQHFELVTSARRYALWLWGNPLDLALWLGPGVLMLGVVGSVWAWRRWRAEPWLADVALAAAVFWGMLLLLNFSGMSRGEVGRLWLFLMPYPLALALLPDWGFRGRAAILVMMGLWSMAVAWVIPPFGII
jgi:hypothetical protein